MILREEKLKNLAFISPSLGSSSSNGLSVSHSENKIVPIAFPQEVGYFGNVKDEGKALFMAKVLKILKETRIQIKINSFGSIIVEMLTDVLVHG